MSILLRVDVSQDCVHCGYMWRIIWPLSSFHHHNCWVSTLIYMWYKSQSMGVLLKTEETGEVAVN